MSLSNVLLALLAFFGGKAGVFNAFLSLEMQ
jgi:hypothetical protein